MANELDDLMSLDPLEMTKDDIDSIIAYHRKRRADAAAGVKPSRARKETGPKQSIDLAALGLIKPKVVGPAVKRRV